MVEVEDLLPKVEVLEGAGPALPHGQGVLVIRDRNALLRREDRSLAVHRLVGLASRTAGPGHAICVRHERPSVVEQRPLGRYPPTAPPTRSRAGLVTLWQAGGHAGRARSMRTDQVTWVSDGARRPCVARRSSMKIVPIKAAATTSARLSMAAVTRT